MADDTASRLELAYHEYHQGHWQSIRACATHFGVPRSTLHNRLQTKMPVMQKRRSSHRLLSDAQEGALIAKIDRLIRWNHLPRLATISRFADALLKLHTEEGVAPRQCGVNWARRWVAGFPQWKINWSKPMEHCRIIQYSRPELEAFYNNFMTTLQDYGVDPDDIYNMDETGVMMGVARRTKVVGCRNAESLTPDQRNRETATIIECVGASGFALSPLVIVKGR
jgi:hypothetical protein